MFSRYLQGFLAGPPSSWCDYITSIHTFPLLSSICLAVGLKFYGFHAFWSFIIIGVGTVATCFVFSIQPLPIFSPIGGRYNVGITYLNGRVSQQMPPLVVFYPTVVPPKEKGIPYLPFGDLRFLHGIAKYVRLPGFLLSDWAFIRVRVTPEAEPLDLVREGKAPFPVIVFSHGLAGYHSLYSCFLSDLAARGAIVVGIGHCDGSASFMRDGGSEGCEVPFKVLGWEVPVRESQLAVRVAETRQTLKRIVNKEFWSQIGFQDESIKEIMNNQYSLHLVGHSFGGATALSAALMNDNEKHKISSVVVFDPWYLTLQNKHFLLPIQSGQKEYVTPTLMMHSKDWVNSEENWNFFQQATSSVLSQPVVSSMHDDEKHELFVTDKSGGISHTALADASVVNPVLSTKLQVVPPRAQIVDFANSALSFIKRHSGQRET